MHHNEEFYSVCFINSIVTAVKDVTQGTSDGSKFEGVGQKVTFVRSLIR